MPGQPCGHWLRSLAANRRTMVGVLATAAGTLRNQAPGSARKKRKKKKVKLCLAGQTISAPKSRKKKLLKRGAVPGACAEVCTCPAGQVCVAGACHACTVTCNDNAIGCGARLQQALTDGGAIYACPGRYQGNFTMGSARLFGAGPGEDPARNTILDAAGDLGVIRIDDQAAVELHGLRITGGKLEFEGGGGVRALTGDLRITNCVITGNTARYGGGIHTTGSLRLTNTTVARNAAEYTSGVMIESVTPTAPNFITDSIITGNVTTAPSITVAAGGLYNQSAAITITGTEISGNTSNGAGGGVVNQTGTITFTSSCRIINNTGYLVGSIYNNTGTVTLNGATVTGNTPNPCLNVSGC
jgi:predicted outer membrane repeat protein